MNFTLAYKIVNILLLESSQLELLERTFVVCIRSPRLKDEEFSFE